jgi:DNA-directed RNA polymerase specialized sigma24 family protein
LATGQESFDALLSWLDPTRDVAGQKYEIIRSGLIRMFTSQGFSDAEDLADLTINRVIDRLPDIRDGYVGEPARYFHGVARNVIHEARRRRETATDNVPETVTQEPPTTDKYDCLLKCLKLLSDEKRELILDYYLYQGRDKIEHHRRMAGELGLTESALRSRAHHIRVALEKCVLQCTRDLVKTQKPAWRALLKKRQAAGDIYSERYTYSTRIKNS